MFRCWETSDIMAWRPATSRQAVSLAWGAWTRASTDLSYQLPVPTNHRRLLAFGSPLLECLDAPWPG